MLDNGADIDSKDIKGYSPLHKTILEIGADYGAIENFLYWSPKLRASMNFCVELLKLGPDIESVNHKGETLLYTAIKVNNHIFAEILVDKGANANNQKIKKKFGPLSFVYSKIFGPARVSEYERRLRSVPDMNEKNSIDGHTLLHRAVIHKFDIESIKIIIKSNANVNCQDLKGNTPLHYLKAEESYDRKVLKLFIDYGADISIQNNEGAVSFSKEECDFKNDEFSSNR